MRVSPGLVYHVSVSDSLRLDEAADWGPTSVSLSTVITAVAAWTAHWSTFV